MDESEVDAFADEYRDARGEHQAVRRSPGILRRIQDQGRYGPRQSAKARRSLDPRLREQSRQFDSTFPQVDGELRFGVAASRCGTMNTMPSIRVMRNHSRRARMMSGQCSITCDESTKFTEPSGPFAPSLIDQGGEDPEILHGLLAALGVAAIPRQGVRLGAVPPAQATAHPLSRLIEVHDRGFAHCGGDLRHARAGDSARLGNTRLDRRGGQLHAVQRPDMRFPGPSRGRCARAHEGAVRPARSLVAPHDRRFNCKIGAGSRVRSPTSTRAAVPPLASAPASPAISRNGRWPVPAARSIKRMIAFTTFG